ncbi:GIY-YIG nuclease family protein [Corynebacterium sp. P7202]|uniref:GIY-YIG nuclease family protein n=1 Tax=Corynebacterium pygosceleis TaxID=2800406 RepID=A0A9Q4C8B6_9CORY|nr:GIY-YIG nuclease family protein [Corynebacterium pygosceleis]MCK7638063.1 GIY-YIG nuclease family protein [Corynebacterium pygosceleis]MCX7468779.1 GIY-YIG nuclease family protein [Corynebacterium pygosceleis]
MSVGKSVRLFLADGTPGGLLTAEIMNWTGHVVAAPRSDLAALLKRPEASRTGIYILLGDDPESLGRQLAYIGEGDNVSRRLYQHARPENQNGKDFWDRAIVLTSKDVNLTKAHARYLESRFITLAQNAGRARLTNGTTPPPITLPEADVSDMEYFIEQAKIVLPVLGVNIFRSSVTAIPAPQDEPATTQPDSPLFEMKLKKFGIVATAREVDGEFTVIEGSAARLKWTGDKGHSYTTLRAKLEQDGTLVPTPDGSVMRFTRSHVFASPSAAAAIVAGRSANGRITWLVKGTGTTYGQWQDRGIEEAMQLEANDE